MDDKRQQQFLYIFGIIWHHTGCNLSYVQKKNEKKWTVIGAEVSGCGQGNSEVWAGR